MAFKPGHKLSVGRGRPVGSRNKMPTIQARLTQFLLDNVEDLQREYNRDMSTGQKIRLYEVLLPFASPKLQANSTDQYTHYDDEQLDRSMGKLADKLLEQKTTIKLRNNAKIEEAHQG